MSSAGSSDAKERANVNDYEPRYHCTLDPVGGDHDVGCPHQTWTVEHLQEALHALKRVNDYLSDTLLEQKTGGSRYGLAGRQESAAGA